MHFMRMPNKSQNHSPGIISGALLSLIIGSLYFYFLAWLWGYIVAYNPLHDHLLDLARNGMPVAYRVAVFIQDFLINIFAMLPLTLIIFRLRPSGSWLNIILALLACKATEMFPVWGHLIGYFKKAGVIEYLIILIQTAAPTLLIYWKLRKKLNSGIIFSAR